jgi:hypothetical protein
MNNRAFPIRRKPLPTNLDVKTKRPSWRSRAKLSTLLAIEIETAARGLQECIDNGNWAGLEDSLRFIELQISFVKEVNSMVPHRCPREKKRESGNRFPPSYDLACHAMPRHTATSTGAAWQ